MVYKLILVCNLATWILHCHWLKFWSRDTDVSIILLIISIKNEKLLNSNNHRSKPKLLRLLWDIVVLRLVAYLLNMICLNLLFYTKFNKYKFSYKFDTILYQFIRDRNIRQNSYGSPSTLKMLGFQPIPPFIFPLQSL